MITLSEFVAKLPSAKKQGKGFTALCPAHDDNKRSLSINEASDKILIHCLANCEPESVVAAIPGVEWKDLFKNASNGSKPKPKRTVTSKNFICAYEYKDASGEIAYTKDRYEVTYNDGTKDKEFSYWRFNENGEKKYNKEGISLPYNLPQIIESLKNNPDQIIGLTEGEKDADEVAKRLGIAVTSFKDWKPEFNEYIAGANAVMFEDHDTTGKGLAEKNRAVFQSVIKNLKIVDVYEKEALPTKQGKDISDWFSEGHSADELKQIIETTSPINLETDVINFRLAKDGVYYIDSNSKTRICSPLKILAETQNKHGENYGRLIEWTDSKNRVKKWSLPIELVHSETGEHIKYLVSRGLELKPTRFARQKLSEYIAESKPAETVICTDKIGWYDEQLFVFPERTIGKSEEKQTVIYQSLNQPDHFFNTSGTLDQWRENIASLCVGNSRLMFSISVAFAASLLTPLKIDGSGYHLRGSSSLGKSTALLVGGSVWGGTAHKGFLKSWRTTSNALESTAEAHNDALLCLDELKECDPKAASEAAYMLPGGEGKTRMNRNAYSRKTPTWKLLFLSSGELSLSDLVAQLNTNNSNRTYGGQEVRMCDIPADAEKGMGLFENLHGFESAELFAKTLTENSKKYYGSAIADFLKLLSENQELAKDRWAAFRAKFKADVEPLNASEEVQRVASQFALVAYGGWLAYEICGWTGEQVFDACKTVFKSWLDGRQGKGGSDEEKVIQNIRFFLDTHGSSRFQNWNSEDEEQKIINMAGYKRIKSIDETQFIIYPDTFKLEMCKGFNSTMVAKALKNRGFLVTDNGKLQKTENISNIGSRKMYVISSKIFDESETEI